MAFVVSLPAILWRLVTILLMMGCTQLENVQESKYSGMNLCHTGPQCVREDDKCLKPEGSQFCWSHSESLEDLLRVGYQKQKACHALDLSSLRTLCRPLWMSSLVYKDSHIHILCYNQSPHPPRFLSKDAAGCETKHKHTFQAIENKPSRGRSLTRSESNWRSTFALCLSLVHP